MVLKVIGLGKTTNRVNVDRLKKKSKTKHKNFKYGQSNAL